ncbi:VanW family protein [Bacillus sp. EB106-08-02-XG196]|uniref:VanW family protein n=1 Tax=Bacillus sp. EB106-08-02-XG196 TaxID=2737049 RepID=UPI0015C44A46|nr:VanW family protein [Bacillus sp. EB106-08-02-XG196]NWQ40205.1 VanW family protein [Bacillus sp. EB106-08-02-XG196]
MNKHQPFIKLFVVLFLSAGVIFSSSHFGAKAFENITNSSAGMYSEGTMVGSIDISGKTESETIALLEEKYVEWVKNTKFELQYSEKVVPFDSNLFRFDATQSVYSIKDGQSNIVSMTIELMPVEDQIQLQFPQIDLKGIEISKLITDLQNTAAKLETGSYKFNLNKDYLIAEASKKDNVISTAIVKLTEVPNDLVSLVTANPEIQISDGADFSLLEFAKLQKLESSSSLNVIATGIYQTILPTNFKIVERNISSALPNYSAVGFEAKVNAATGADFIIVNPNTTPYTVELKLDNKDLIVTLKGEKFLYDYKISKKEAQQLKPKTIVQYSPLLLPGKIKVLAIGGDGQIVKIYRETYQGVQLINSEFLFEDYYPPVYRVEVHGLIGTQGAATTETPATANEGDSTGNPPTPPAKIDQDSDDDLWGKPNEQPK